MSIMTFTHNHAPARLAFCGLIFLSLSVSRAADLFDETTGTTLFAFDEVSIPHSQNLRLEMRAPTKYPANPVVRRGEPGAPDAMGVQRYDLAGDQAPHVFSAHSQQPLPHVEEGVAS